MPRKTTCAAALLACAAGVFAQPQCEGGAYLNPLLIRGVSASAPAAIEAEAALAAIMARTGLSAKPIAAIRRKDELAGIARSSRPPCWIVGNAVAGLVAGYKAAAVNMEPVRVNLFFLTDATSSGTNAAPVALDSLPASEQSKLRERLRKARCFGLGLDVATEIARTEGLCAKVEDVAPRGGIGPEALAGKAVFEWDEKNGSAFVSTDPSLGKSRLQGLPGKSAGGASARMVTLTARTEGVGYGLFVHPSIGEVDRLKAASIFLEISLPSKPVAAALDLGPGFSFSVPNAAQTARMGAAIGLANAKVEPASLR